MNPTLAKFIAIASVRQMCHVPEKEVPFPHISSIGAVQKPGTMFICCQCAKHNQRFNSSRGRGWYYCNSICEAETIVKPVALEVDGVIYEACHWFSAGGLSKHTPHTDGRKQVLNPDWDGPPSPPYD